jgi:hypothetical protein
MAGRGSRSIPTGVSAMKTLLIIFAISFSASVRCICQDKSDNLLIHVKFADNYNYAHSLFLKQLRFIGGLSVVDDSVDPDLTISVIFMHDPRTGEWSSSVIDFETVSANPAFWGIKGKDTDWFEKATKQTQLDSQFASIGTLRNVVEGSVDYVNSHDIEKIRTQRDSVNAVFEKIDKETNDSLKSTPSH